MKSKNLIILICFILASVFISDVYGQTYGNLPMGGLGFVSGIITNKKEQNLIYARTDVGGAYRWDNNNSKWIPLLDWCSDSQTSYQGVEALASDPTNTANLYMLVGTSYWNGGITAILRSTNRGASFSITDVTSQFKASGNGMGRNTGEKLVVDPNLGNILFCGSRANGLFKSTNSGLTWTKTSLGVTTTPDGNGISFVVFDPSTGSAGSATKSLLVGVSRLGLTNLYRSDDAGATFYAVSGATTAYMPERAVISTDRYAYITYGNGCGPSPYTSITPSEPMDAGQIWKYHLTNGYLGNVTPATCTRSYGGISIDPKNANRLIASTINTYWTQGSSYGDQIFISIDAGVNWTNVVSRGFTFDANGVSWAVGRQQAIHWAGSIEFDPFNTKRVFITSGNGIFSTTNIDATPCVWKFTVQGLEETVPKELVSISGGPILSTIADYDGFSHNSVTAYSSNRFSPSIGTNTGLAVAANNTTKAVRVGNTIHYSTNTGSTWTQCAVTKATGGYLALSSDGSVILHSPGSGSAIYRSTDNGSTWSTVSGIGISNSKIVADPENASKFYVYNTSTGYLMKSTNGGVSFVNGKSIGKGGSKRIVTVDGYQNHIWIAMFGGGLQRSIDGGSTTSTINTITNCSAVGIGKAATGATYPTLYVYGTYNGVQGIYRSIDQGVKWTRINDDAHEWGGSGNAQFLIGDMNTFGRVYMSTVGRGIVYIESGSLASKVKQVTDDQIDIEQIDIEQNDISILPNPFNGTNLTVKLGELNGETAIKLIDLNGRIIKEETFYDQHRVQLNVNIKTGTYLVQIKNAQKTVVKKLIVK